MKKVNLPVSRQFRAGHPRAGQTTGMINKLLSGSKIHTIRDNIEYWTGKIAKVNAGEMYISVKMWIGRPYHTAQQEMHRIMKAGTQVIEMTYTGGILTVLIDGDIYPDHEALVANDGLSFEDFIGCFFSGKRSHYKGVIIHFTDFRY